jgi:hypothetical protein
MWHGTYSLGKHLGVTHWLHLKSWRVNHVWNRSCRYRGGQRGRPGPGPEQTSGRKDVNVKNICFPVILPFKKLPFKEPNTFGTVLLIPIESLSSIVLALPLTLSVPLFFLCVCVCFSFTFVSSDSSFPCNILTLYQIMASYPRKE